MAPERSHSSAWSGADDEAPAGTAQRIGVGAGDESVVRVQLAARWAEAFAPPQGDNLAFALERFRHAYEYLDAVMHGIEPPVASRHEAAPAESDVAAAG